MSVVYNGPGDFDNFYINKNLNNSLITKPYLLYVGKRNSYKNFINFIKDYFIQLLLLILVFVIIYIVDHISNINTIIFSTPSVVPNSKPLVFHPKRRKTLKK